MFTISSSGEANVLYSFSVAPDGSTPYGALTNVGDALYGTTQHGGSNYPSKNGCGTVFRVSLGGTEQVLHSFNADGGCLPLSTLIYSNGKLYGTTSAGGIGCFKGAGRLDNGCGTVFSITPSGTFVVLHRFDLKRDPAGATPLSGLTYMKGALYGTTYQGGAYHGGTVFAFTPP